MTARIRSSHAGDLEAVEELLRLSALPLDGVKECFEDFVVAEVEGRVVGVTGLQRLGGIGLLRSAAVAPTLRGQGIGAELVLRVIADARRWGLRELYLLTTTAAEYFPAFGFEPVSRDLAPEGVRRTEQFTTSCSKTAIVMRRIL